MQNPPVPGGGALFVGAMKRFAAVLFPTCILLLARPGHADVDRHHYQQYPHLEGKPIRQVLVLGNNRTQDVVFRREMRLREGIPFHAEDLWRDWERITDLGLFAEVEVDAVASDDGVLAVVSVHERPSWFIAPILDYDFDEKAFTFGYRTRLRNLDGLNRTLRSTARAGEVDRFNISWESPYIGDRRQTLNVALDVELPRPEVDELRSNRIEMSTTRFLGDYLRTRMGLTFLARMEILRRDGTHPEGPVEQLSPAVGLGWSRDKRNVRVDPHRGTFTSSIAELVSGWTDDDLSYGRLHLDGRVFVPVGPFVLASRAGAILTTGSVPDYRRVGVGGANSIRGQPDDVKRGTNIFRSSVEVRFPMLPRKRFGLPIPLVPKRISNVDIRVDGEVFVDTGTAWDPDFAFGSSRFKSGGGVGLRIFMPILELVRLEVAFDESGEPTLILREGNII